jgi:hypothetical protein
MTAFDVLTFAVLAFVGVRLAQAAHVSVLSRSRMWLLVRGVRLRHVLLAIPVLAAVVAVALALFTVPGLSWGWWTALGGEGNPVFGTSKSTQGSPFEVIVPLAFLVVLVPGLPLLVEREEQVFRSGAEQRTWVQNAGRCVVFGLAHAVVGIPIGAALALSIGGGYLTVMYLRGLRATGTEAGALAESTRAHLAYDLVIVALVPVALVVDLALGA